MALIFSILSILIIKSVPNFGAENNPLYIEKEKNESENVKDIQADDSRTELTLTASASKKTTVRIYYKSVNDTNFSLQKSIKITLQRKVNIYSFNIDDNFNNLKIEFGINDVEVLISQLKISNGEDSIKWGAEAIINEFRFINCIVNSYDSEVVMISNKKTNSRPFIDLNSKGQRRVQNIVLDSQFINQSIEVISNSRIPSRFRVYYAEKKNSFNANQSYLHSIGSSESANIKINILTHSPLNKFMLEYYNEQENEIYLDKIQVALNNLETTWHYSDIISEFRFTGFSKITVNNNHLQLTTIPGIKNRISLSPTGINKLMNNLHGVFFYKSTLTVHASSEKDIAFNMLYLTDLDGEFSPNNMYRKYISHSNSKGEYTFPILSNFPIKKFRFDFSHIPDNEIVINSIRFKNENFTRNWSSTDLAKKFNTNSYLTLKDINSSRASFVTNSIDSVSNPSLRLNSELMSESRETFLLVRTLSLMILVSIFLFFKNKKYIALKFK